jgi:hypothetical protein
MREEQMIVHLRRLFVCFLLFTSPLFGQSAGKAPMTRAELRADLLGSFRGSLQQGLPGQSVVPPPEGRKSVGLAALYSLLLPGMGELYAGSFSSGRYFLAAEGALWLTYAVFQVRADALRDDARSFAIAHAGISLGGKNDQYFVDIGNFLNIDEYNQKKLRDREVEKLYDPALGFAWQWDSDASRSAYRDQRVASDNSYNNRKFVVAVVLINHVASAINAARSAVSHNKALESALSDVHIEAEVLGGPFQAHGMVVTVRKMF